MASIDIVFDGGPENGAREFVGVQDPATGDSIRAWTWVHLPDGYWALRVELPDAAPPTPDRWDLTAAESLRSSVDISHDTGTAYDPTLLALQSIAASLLAREQREDMNDFVRSNT